MSSMSSVLDAPSTIYNYAFRGSSSCLTEAASSSAPESSRGASGSARSVKAAKLAKGSPRAAKDKEVML